MADEIKQSDNIGRVQPLNPSRNAGQRKRQRQPAKREREQAERSRRKPADDDPHHVDEYV